MTFWPRVAVVLLSVALLMLLGGAVEWICRATGG